MGTYKGNAGNLMQHWTLCGLLTVACRHTSGLSFIDAHAMAPLASGNKSRDDRFARVQDGLSSHPGSVYERAWRNLTPDGGYPNSAAFVKEVWKGDFSLLLCEIDRSTITELEPWLERVDELARCKSAKLFQCDWRERFEDGLPSPSEMGLSCGSLTLVSFDPDMYNRRRFAKRDPRNLYPEDIERASDAVSSLEGGILIQMSTYSANDNNPQGAVISSVNSILAAKGFTLSAVVRVDGNMMSLVYARNVSWSAELTDLPDRFNEWLGRHSRRPGLA